MCRTLATPQSARALRGPAGPDEAALVGEDDQVRAVAGAELHHRAADVRADGGDAEVQLLRDLVVLQALADEGHDLPLAVGEHRAARLARRLLGPAGVLGQQPL